MKVAVVVILIGTISQYAPGVMEEVIQNRTTGIAPSVTPEKGAFAIAVERCEWLNRRGEMEIFLDGEPHSFLVFVADCAGGDTAEWMRNNNIIAEVEYKVAERYGFVGRGVRGRLILFPPSTSVWPRFEKYIPE